MATNQSQKRYPPALRERAVRMVRETIEENHGERFGAVTRVPPARHRRPVPAELGPPGRGRRPPGVSTEERRRVAELEQRRSASSAGPKRILKAAASLLARELDPRLPK